MLDRRGFVLRSLAAGLGGGGFLTACGLGGDSEHGGAAFADDAGSEEGAGQGAGSRGGSPEELSTWEGVRAQFRLDPELVHMSALVLASHPRPVGVEGLSSDAAVLRLREADVVATTSPYRSNHARLSPSIYNTDEEVERALSAVRALRR